MRLIASAGVSGIVRGSVRKRQVLCLTAAAVLATTWIVALGIPRASATTLTASPDPTPDGAPGSLRAVLAAATSPGGDEIDLQAGGTYTLTCPGGQLVHSTTTPLTITTPSGPPATIRQTCPGQRVLTQSLGLLLLNNVVITGGNYAPGLPFLATGGAIQEQFGSVVVTNSTFENNSVTAPPGEGLATEGGAIAQSGFNVAGQSSVTVINSTFTNNQALGSADPSCLSTPGSCGDVLGGAIHADNPVTVENSTFTGNTATAPIPGPVNSGIGAHGGAIDSSVFFTPPFGGPVTVTNSTFSDNTASAPHTWAYGGAISADGIPTSTTVTNSVFAHNSATGEILASGGAISLPSCCGVFGTTAPPIAVSSSTFNDNSATAPVSGVGWGGAIGVAVAGDIPPITTTNATLTRNTASTMGGAVAAAHVDAVYSTIVENTAPMGANVGLFGSILGSTGLTSFGSVVALAHGGGSNCTLASHPTSSSFSFSDDSSCDLTGPGDRQDAGDPMLGSLANNGGPAPTRLPLSGSPLVDAIPVPACQAAGITTDERGLPRPDAGAPTCDVGAVEVQMPGVPAPAAILITPRFTG